MTTEKIYRSSVKDRARERARYALKKDDPEFRAEARQRSRDHYQANKEKYREKAKLWRLQNKDRHNYISRMSRYRRWQRKLEELADGG